MNKTTKGISLAFTMFAIVGMFSFAPIAASTGDEGCTPGFWKANAKKGANAWPMDPPDADTITPSTTLTSIGIVNTNGYNITGLTFLEALQLKGGNDLSEKEEILLRAGAAALLNAAHLESVVDYSYNYDGSGGVIEMLNEALASDNKSTIVSQAGDFDEANNAGCPFNNSGRP